MSKNSKETTGKKKSNTVHLSGVDPEDPPQVDLFGRTQLPKDNGNTTTEIVEAGTFRSVNAGDAANAAAVMHDERHADPRKKVSFAHKVDEPIDLSGAKGLPPPESGLDMLARFTGAQGLSLFASFSPHCGPKANEYMTKFHKYAFFPGYDPEDDKVSFFEELEVLCNRALQRYVQRTLEPSTIDYVKRLISAQTLVDEARARNSSIREAELKSIVANASLNPSNPLLIYAEVLMSDYIRGLPLEHSWATPFARHGVLEELLKALWQKSRVDEAILAIKLR